MGLDNPLHLGFLLLMLLLVFGAKRLPEIGRSLGSGMRGFKSAINGSEEQGALGTGEGTRVGDAVGVQDGARGDVLAMPSLPRSEPPPPEAA